MLNSALRTGKRMWRNVPGPGLPPALCGHLVFVSLVSKCYKQRRAFDGWARDLQVVGNSRYDESGHRELWKPMEQANLSIIDNIQKPIDKGFSSIFQV